MLLLNFTAGPNRYAIDVMRVVELVPRVELRLIPHAPPALAGLLGYRGHVVPVIDLGILLGASPCRYCLSTRIILVRCAGDDHDHSGPDPGFAAAGKDKARQDPSGPSSLLGLIAERASDLTYAQPDQLVPAPVSLPQAPYLGALVQTDGGIFQLIDVERLRDAALGFAPSLESAVVPARSAMEN